MTTWWVRWRGTLTTGAIVLGVASAVALASVGTIAAIQAPTQPPMTKPVPKVVAKPKQSVVAPVAGTVYGTVLTAPGGHYTVTAWDVNKRTGALSFIAEQFHTNVHQLVVWNRISDPDVISVGQRLRIR